VLSPPFLGGRKTVWLQGFGSFGAEGTATSKSADAQAFRRLAEVIRKGVPADVFLVLSGPGIDSRKALHQACQEAGEVVLCQKPDVRNWRWREAMAEVVRSRAEAKKVTLSEEVCAYLVEVLGTDTGRVDTELEKLICYCGGTGEPLTLAAAEEICRGDGETASWAIRDVVGTRDLDQVLALVDKLLRPEKDPDSAVLGLLAQIAAHLRQLLQVRVFMQERRLRRSDDVSGALRGLGQEELAACRARGLEFVDFHTYRNLQLGRQATNYSGPELVRGIVAARDTYWRCVSSEVAKRALLEEFLMRLVPRPAATPAATRR